MTRTTNNELVDHFARGGDDGKANRMAIEERDGWTLLWGYGHALYGARSPTGTLYVYMGWYGYSQTTSTHLNALKGKAKRHYGDPRDDGESVVVAVDGEGGATVQQAPPSGHELIVPDEGQPGTSYGRFDADGRPELDAFDGEHLSAPNGYGG